MPPSSIGSLVRRFGSSWTIYDGRGTTPFRQLHWELREENKQLRAKSRWYEAAYTAPKNNRALMSRRPQATKMTTGLLVPAVEHLDAISGTTQPTEMLPNRIEKLRSPATTAQSVARTLTSRCGSDSNPSKRFLPAETTQYNCHYYEYDACGTETVASHPDCSDKGLFGVNVIAQAMLSKYERRLLLEDR